MLEETELGSIFSLKVNAHTDMRTKTHTQTARLSHCLAAEITLQTPLQYCSMIVRVHL